MGTRFFALINGKRYTQFKEINLSRKIDNLCGDFSIITPYSSNYPIKEDDPISIYIGSNLFLTGYVFDIDITSSINGSSISIIGQDKTTDILDSSIPDNAKTPNSGITLKEMCELIIDGLGIPDISVIDESNIDLTFSENHFELGGSFSGNCWEMLQEMARSKQVIIRTNPSGNIVIYRPTQTFAEDYIKNTKNSFDNNVLMSRFFKSKRGRYGKYVCSSQDNYATEFYQDSYSDEGDQRSGQAIDFDVRQTRYLEINAELSLTDNDCTDRAVQEANIRRTQNQIYTCETILPIQSNGKLWDIGELVYVKDDIIGANGYFILSSFNCLQDINSGTRTTLELIPSDAFLQISSEDENTKRKITTP